MHLSFCISKYIRHSICFFSLSLTHTHTLHHSIPLSRCISVFHCVFFSLSLPISLSVYLSLTLYSKIYHLFSSFCLSLSVSFSFCLCHPESQNIRLSLCFTISFCLPMNPSFTKYYKLTGYGRRLMFRRLWVPIPGPHTGWTFFTFICCKHCNDVFLKRPKINYKRGRNWPI